MSLLSIGLPDKISTSFLAAGDASAGASSYLRMDAGDQQSFTLLASGDSSSPDYGTLTIASKAAGPVPVQRPLVIRPDGSVNVQSLTIAGVPVSGGGSIGVASVNGLGGAVTLAAGANVSLNASGQTLTISASGGGGGSGGIASIQGLTGPAVAVEGAGQLGVTAKDNTLTLSVPYALGDLTQPQYVGSASVGGSGQPGNAELLDATSWPIGLYSMLIYGVDSTTVINPTISAHVLLCKTPAGLVSNYFQAYPAIILGPMTTPNAANITITLADNLHIAAQCIGR